MVRNPNFFLDFYLYPKNTVKILKFIKKIQFQKEFFVRFTNRNDLKTFFLPVKIVHFQFFYLLPLSNLYVTMIKLKPLMNGMKMYIKVYKTKQFH